MHVLWLVPDYYSFLAEELRAVAPRIERLSVISQAPAAEIDGVTAVTLSPTPITLVRMARRLASIARGLAKLPLPKSPQSRQAFFSAVRQSEFIEDFIRAEQVDVIHSHFAHPVGTGGRLACSDRPLVLTLRGVDILVCESIGYGYRLDPYYCQTLHETLNQAAAVTVASTTSRNALVDFHGVHDSFHTIPNGVDLGRFDASLSGRNLRKRLGIGNRPLILAIGNLVAGKSFDNLILALIAVRKTHPEAAAIIVGDGKERERLEKQVEKLALGDAVQLVGRVDREEIAQYYAACDVFVHCSLSEGFGNVILEAMAMRRPVVATRTGVALDYIKDGQSGLSVPTGRIEPLAQAIIRMLSDRDFAEQCSANAQLRVLAEDLSMEQRAMRFVEIYESVSNSNSR